MLHGCCCCCKGGGLGSLRVILLPNILAVLSVRSSYFRCRRIGFSSRCFSVLFSGQRGWVSAGNSQALRTRDAVGLLGFLLLCFSPFLLLLRPLCLLLLSSFSPPSSCSSFPFFYPPHHCSTVTPRAARELQREAPRDQSFPPLPLISGLSSSSLTGGPPGREHAGPGGGRGGGAGAGWLARPKTSLGASESPSRERIPGPRLARSQVRHGWRPSSRGERE